MEKKKTEVQNQLNKFYEAREDLYNLFDSVIPKKEGLDIYDFDKCDSEIVKELYKKFYSYDYEARKFQPILRKYYEGE